MKFYIIDAFTNELFGGNPAGVIFVDEFLKKETMIKYANELRYSETAFIKVANDINIRYFTPTDEVDMCGHATIASIKALLEEKIIQKGKNYSIKTKAGLIKIEVKESILMDMPKASIIKKDIDKSDVFKVINTFDFKVDVAKCGLTDLMVRIKDRFSLNNLNINLKNLVEISKKYDVVGMHAYSIDNDKIYARNFAPLFGIDEESATGTSNAALTYLLYKEGLIKENIINSIIQGEKINRASLINTQVINKDNPIIKVGGNSKILAKGIIL